MLWRAHLVWVVLVVVVAVVLIVELFAATLGLTLGLLAVDVVGALGLGEPVDLSTSEAGDQLLGELVGDGLACARVYVSDWSGAIGKGEESRTYRPYAGGPRRS